MSSDLTIIPVLNTPHVNPGEKIEIEFFFTGAGDIEKHKFFLSRLPKSIRADDRSRFTTGIIDGEEDGQVITGDAAIENEATTTFETKFGEARGRFADNVFNPHRVDYEVEPEEYHPIVSEYEFDGHPPLKCILPTAESARPGDYQIYSVLTFGTEEKINQTSVKVPVHVNNKREQLEPWPTVAGITAGLVALLSLLYSTGILTVVFGNI